MANKVLKMAANPWKMKLYLLFNLPMAFIAGLKVIEASGTKVSVSVPYKFLNKNPFKSMYFAVLSMAAELPTGIIALNEVSNNKIPVSMLVLNMKASFLKKTRSKVVFSCTDIEKIKTAISESVAKNEGQTVVIESVGIDQEDNIVAEFSFEWTFKPKI